MRPRFPTPPLAAVILALVAAACEGGPADGPAVVQDVVSADAVVGLLDTARTYEYAFAQADADSLITVLWNAGLPLTQAWLPLDNLCADPRGPVFTVELEHPDPGIRAYDFVLGTGRLACATRLRRYRLR